MGMNWDHRTWEVSNGVKTLKIEAAKTALFDVMSQGIEVERWWDPKRGTYFAYGKAAHFGISTQPHQDVERVMPDGVHVGIDELLVDPIQALWDAGIETYGSCQGDARAGDPRTGGFPGRWGYIYVLGPDVNAARSIIRPFGFKHLTEDDRERTPPGRVYRFKGLTSG